MHIPSFYPIISVIFYFSYTYFVEYFLFLWIFVRTQKNLLFSHMFFPYFRQNYFYISNKTYIFASILYYNECCCMITVR